MKRKILYNARDVVLLRCGQVGKRKVGAAHQIAAETLDLGKILNGNVRKMPVVVTGYYLLF